MTQRLDPWELWEPDEYDPFKPGAAPWAGTEDQTTKENASAPEGSPGPDSPE